MTNNRKQFVLLTGPPGIGKTTLVKKVCKILKEKQYQTQGFITEEVRNGRQRIGFDIVLMDGTRAPLARLEIISNMKGPKVGKYCVDLSSFETQCLTQLTNKQKDSILVLDEIGKMELFSSTFKNKIAEIFGNEKQVVLGTVPLKTNSVPIVEKIKSNPRTILISVDYTNRDVLPDQVVKHLIEDISHK